MLSQMVLDPAADREVPIDHQVTVVNMQVGRVPICAESPTGRSHTTGQFSTMTCEDWSVARSEDMPRSVTASRHMLRRAFHLCSALLLAAVGLVILQPSVD